MADPQKLAKVGDRIEHGEAIPANVVRMADAHGTDVLDPPTAFWIRRAPGLFSWRGHSESRALLTDSEPDWWPLTVVEVDPEPQPADPAPSGLCEVGPDRIRCVITDPDHRRIYHLGRPYEPQPVEISTTCQGCGNYVPPPAVHKRTCPTRSGPLVLTLPVVPDGATLTGASGHSYVLRGGVWDDTDGPWSGKLGAVLDREHPDGVTVEMAPPCELRVWEQLDPGTDDLQVVECLGVRYTRGDDSLWYGDRTSRTWLQLRAMGEVREVLT